MLSEEEIKEGWEEGGIPTPDKIRTKEEIDALIEKAKKKTEFEEEIKSKISPKIMAIMQDRQRRINNQNKKKRKK